MKQIAQRLRDGRIEVVEAPPPVLRPGCRWSPRYSLTSAGAQRSKLELGSKSLLGKPAIGRLQHGNERSFRLR
jgi:hypothetical protein